MSPQDGPNRRRFPRHACQLGVRYRHALGEHTATALDLTTHGCRLHVGEDLARGTALTLAFDRPLADGVRELTVEVTGVVAWCRSDAFSREVGVRFDEEAVGLSEIIQALNR